MSYEGRTSNALGGTRDPGAIRNGNGSGNSRPSPASAIAHHKGCGTRRIGHSQWNLTSCKKVPTYCLLSQKAFPRPVFEVIDERRSSAVLDGLARRSLSAFLNSPRRNHAESALHTGTTYTRAHAFRGQKEIAKTSASARPPDCFRAYFPLSGPN